MVSATQRLEETIHTTTTGKPKVALDTNCVQYYISNPPVQPWADCLDPVFRAGVKGEIELYISTVVVSELLAHVHFTNRYSTGYDPELDLLAIINRHFEILDVNGAVARAAGRLRGNYVVDNRISLKTPDALIGATSLANEHTMFITNDLQLADALPEANRIYLKDIALDWLAQNFPSGCFEQPTPIIPSRYGCDLPSRVSPNLRELGGVQLNSSATWRRILKDAQTVACTVNEPCVIFVLSSKNGRRLESREVLFWHEGLYESRPPRRIIRRLQEHLDYSGKARKAINNNQVHAFVFASLAREKAKLNQPSFAAMNEHKKRADAWNNYLSMWRVLRPCLKMPQVVWLICEDGATHSLSPDTTTKFLDRAGNVLGWNNDET